MKARIIAILFVTVLAKVSFAQIPNSGFENWTSVGSYIIPDNWGTLNPVTYPSGIYTCMKGAPGNPGATFLKLISKTVPGMGVMPGIAVSGVLNTTTFQAVSGFPYANRPISLRGNWQYMAYGADQGHISVYLTKWKTDLNARTIVGQVVYLLPGMVMSWLNFALPITYNNYDIPDSAMITFAASGTVPVEASYLYIDNLSFYGSTLGIEDQTAPVELLVYPNPVAHDLLSIDLKNRDFGPEYDEIINMEGKVMMRQVLINRLMPISIDVSTLPAGEYLIRIGSQTGTVSKKFLRN